MEVENHCNRREFDGGGGDIEQQEIEHGVDALGSALDHLGHFTCAAREVETQRQAVEPGKDIFCQRSGRFLPHAFEYDVAEIVESDAGKAAQCIGEHEGHGDHCRLIGGCAHRIDGIFIGEGQGQRDGFRCQYETHGNNYPVAQ